jgi:hypothetical protein
MSKKKSRKYVRLYHHRTNKEVRLFRVLERGRRLYSLKYNFKIGNMLIPIQVNNSKYLITFTDLDTRWIAEALSGKLDDMPIYQTQYACLKYIESNLKDIEKCTEKLFETLQNGFENYQLHNSKLVEKISNRISNLSRKNKILSKAYSNSKTIRQKIIDDYASSIGKVENDKFAFIGDLDD